MSHNYWDTDSATTMAKLKTDMESALGVPTSRCNSTSSSIPVAMSAAVMAVANAMCMVLA